MDGNQECNKICTNYVGKNFCSENIIPNKNMNFDRSIKNNKYNDKDNKDSKDSKDSNFNPCKPFNSPSFSNIGVL